MRINCFDSDFTSQMKLAILHLITIRSSSCGKVMFLQVSVCPRGRGGKCTPPLTDTPLCRHPLGRHTPPGRHPLQADSSPHQMATAAEGTHPAGMHSCSFNFFVVDPAKCWLTDAFAFLGSRESFVFCDKYAFIYLSEVKCS